MFTYKYFSACIVVILLLVVGCKKKEVPIPPKTYNFSAIESVYIFNHIFMYRSYVNPNAPLHIEYRSPDTMAVSLVSSQVIQVNNAQLFFVESKSQDYTMYYFTDNQTPEYYSTYYTCEWYPAKDSISLIYYWREPNGLHVDTRTGLKSPM